MKISIEMVIIDRYDTPSNSSTDNHIKSITKSNIGSFISDILPRQGEIIKFESINYVVVEVIRLLEDIYGNESFTIQVVRHSTLKLKQYGSNSWRENIPLCIDIE
jgi:hypothetical protein